MKIKYRGFRSRPFARFNIGRVRVYCIGPVAIFVGHNERRTLLDAIHEADQ